VMRDDIAAARSIVEESVALFRDVGDKWGLIHALHQLAVIVWSEGDYVRSGLLNEEVLALCHELDDKDMIAMVLNDLGDVARYLGDYQRAATLYAEGLTLAQQLEKKQEIAMCLAGLAGLAGATGQSERAARLLGAIETFLDAIGLAVSVWPPVRDDFERTAAAARAQLDEATFAAAWAKGQAMPLEQAVADALTISASDAADPV
jgi:hypothetical protein